MPHLALTGEMELYDMFISNNFTNHLANPISNPTIKNLTLIGRGATGAEPQALKLRVGTKADIDNVVLSNWSVVERKHSNVDSNSQAVREKLMVL